MGDIFGKQFQKNTEAPPPPAEPLEDWLSRGDRVAFVKQHDEWMRGRGFRKFYRKDRYGHIISWWERNFSA